MFNNTEAEVYQEAQGLRALPDTKHDHLDTLESIKNLREVLWAMGRLDDAEGGQLCHASVATSGLPYFS